VADVGSEAGSVSSFNVSLRHTGTASVASTTDDRLRMYLTQARGTHCRGREIMDGDVSYT